MTAPTNPAPLPVVALFIDEDGDAHSSRAVEALIGHGPYLPAVGVPLALFEDGAFGHRVAQRLADSYGHVAPSMMLAFLDAIAAELRERAGMGVNRG